MDASSSLHFPSQMTLASGARRAMRTQQPSPTLFSFIKLPVEFLKSRVIIPTKSCQSWGFLLFHSSAISMIPATFFFPTISISFFILHSAFVHSLKTYRIFQPDFSFQNATPYLPSKDFQDIFQVSLFKPLLDGSLSHEKFQNKNWNKKSCNWKSRLKWNQIK